MDLSEIVIGRSDSTATVFVPWDCGNNCAFCTTKKEYREKYANEPMDSLMQKVFMAIRSLAESPHVKNVVFTGGEPFSDLKRLTVLMQAIPQGKKCFVNTSLHVKDIDDVASRLTSRMYDGLDGISLSCHVCKGGFFDKGILEVARGICATRKVRVNSLVNGEEDEDVVRAFTETVLGEGGFEYLNFRADYRNVTQSELGSAEDPFFKTLMSIPDWEHQGFSGCLVCRSDSFETPYGNVVYHRGVERTSMRFGGKLVINDFVVKQDGEIRYDWCDGATLTDEMYAALGISRS